MIVSIGTIWISPASSNGSSTFTSLDSVLTLRLNILAVAEVGNRETPFGILQLLLKTQGVGLVTRYLGRCGARGKIRCDERKDELEDNVLPGTGSYAGVPSVFMGSTQFPPLRQGSSQVLASEFLEGKVKAPWPGCGLSIGVAAFETFDRVPSSVTLER